MVVKTAVMSTVVVKSTALVLKMGVATLVVELEAEAEKQREGNGWKSEGTTRQSQGNSLGRNGNNTKTKSLQRSKAAKLLKRMKPETG